MFFLSNYYLSMYVCILYKSGVLIGSKDLKQKSNLFLDLLDHRPFLEKYVSSLCKCPRKP